MVEKKAKQKTQERKKELGHTQIRVTNPMATPVKVYGPPLSTAVCRVLACLLEKDVEFQLISLNMAKGDHKKPDFLKIQVSTCWEFVFPQNYLFLVELNASVNV